MRLLKYTGFCILMLLLQGNGFARSLPSCTGKPLRPFQSLFSSEPLSQLNTAGSEFYLSEEEKLVVALCNLARHDGELFFREVLIPAGADTNLSSIKKLQIRLKQSKNLPPLMPAFSLHKTARMHAADMGFSGDSGHISSDGRTFEQRISHYFPNHAGFAENYHLGAGDPAEIVIALLSSGYQNGQYRENILSANLHYIGVSISAHRKSCSNTVIDFAQKPRIPVGEPEIRSKRKKSEAYFMDCPKGRDYDQRRKSLSSFFGIFSRSK